MLVSSPPVMVGFGGPTPCRHRGGSIAPYAAPPSCPPPLPPPPLAPPPQATGPTLLGGDARKAMRIGEAIKEFMESKIPDVRLDPDPFRKNNEEPFVDKKAICSSYQEDAHNRADAKADCGELARRAICMNLPDLSGAVGNVGSCCASFLDKEDRSAAAAAAILSRLLERHTTATDDAPSDKPARQHGGVAVDWREPLGDIGPRCAAFLEPGDRSAAAAAELLSRLDKAAIAAPASGVSRPRRRAPTTPPSRRFCNGWKEAVPDRDCTLYTKFFFDPSTITVHEITPYAEVYGDHPRSFVFNRKGEKVRAAPSGFVGLEEPEEFEEESDCENAPRSNSDASEKDEAPSGSIKVPAESAEPGWESYLCDASLGA